MTESASEQLWTSGEAYERYVGRWSRPVAREFLDWIGAPSMCRWLDVGCGTGALSETIVETQYPGAVRGIDPSTPFLTTARERIRDPRVAFAAGNAQFIPLRDACVDLVVSGLVLNFVPDPQAAAIEFGRVLRRGGTCGVYVWDYAGEMQMMRHFWDAAVALDPKARELDEARRSPICQPGPLVALLEAAQFLAVQARAFDIETTFADFDDYWQPFLSGRAPAPAYAMSLSEQRRDALRDRIRSHLPVASDGSIRLVARAFAVKGIAS